MNLAIRALTGAVYVALTLGAAWAGPVTTCLLFLPACAIAAAEYHHLHWRTGGPRIELMVGLSGIVYLCVSVVAVHPDWNFANALLLAMVVMCIAVLAILTSQRESAVAGLGAILAHVFYIAIPFALLPMLAAMGFKTFAGFMFLLWAGDTGAYLVGKSIGRTKLMPAVSPGKTMEGAVGGLVAALLVAVWLGSWTGSLGLAAWMAMAVIITVTSLLGDLLESALKRAAGVKDSGTILPGHGGMLDRFDGLLLAAPAAMLFLLARA